MVAVQEKFLLVEPDYKHAREPAHTQMSPAGADLETAAAQKQAKRRILAGKHARCPNQTKRVWLGTGLCHVHMNTTSRVVSPANFFLVVFSGLRFGERISKRRNAMVDCQQSALPPMPKAGGPTANGTLVLERRVILYGAA